MCYLLHPGSCRFLRQTWSWPLGQHLVPSAGKGLPLCSSLWPAVRNVYKWSVLPMATHDCEVSGCEEFQPWDCVYPLLAGTTLVWPHSTGLVPSQCASCPSLQTQTPLPTPEGRGRVAAQRLSGNFLSSWSCSPGKGKLSSFKMAVLQAAVPSFKFSPLIIWQA